MNLTEEYIKKVKEINSAETDLEHNLLIIKANAWVDGARDAGGHVSLIDADLHHEGKAAERPMCAGIFQDWKPNAL